MKYGYTTVAAAVPTVTVADCAANADRIIGQEALVTQPINNTLSQGEIKVFGQLWTARAAARICRRRCRWQTRFFRQNV